MPLLPLSPSSASVTGFGKSFASGNSVGLEFVLVLVVVARVAPPNERLLVRAAQNVLVSRSELEIYHRFVLVIVFEN